MSKLSVLISNDDGIQAPGIRVLAETLRTFCDITLVAPHTERSATSQAITITAPIRVHEIADRWFSVEGTPADCVMLAMQHLLPSKPDWVISGINRGANAGTDILYSGTVGAAREGSISGVPSIAVSLSGTTAKINHYETAAEVVSDLLKMLKPESLPSFSLLNVNVPNLPKDQLRGIRAASVGRRIYSGKMWERHDPRGQRYYWIGPAGDGFEQIEGSDCVLLSEGYATVSVLKSDFYFQSGTDALSIVLGQLK